jgi:inhibitor of KinA sporulation pathway (predicted exonuclease)
MRTRQRDISEIIEIGAVRLRAESLEELAEYQAFVRPLVNPELSDFCRELTHISQAEVDRAPPFVEAWALFLAWLQQHPGPTVMMSWSNYDDHLFRRQCAENGLEAPPWVHLDMKAEFGRWVFSQDGTKSRFRLADAMARAGLQATGEAHRALSDARNTARLLRHIRDPRSLSDPSRRAVVAIASRHPRPTHAGHLRDLMAEPRPSWGRLKHELLRLGLATDLPEGRGMVLSGYGLSVAADLALDSTDPAGRPPGEPGSTDG